MEFFTKTKAIKLRSHLDKYLLADDDGYTVRQTRTSASSPPATWFVELIDGRNDVVRLRSSFGTYLTASDAPFLLGAAGYKAVQTSTTGGSPAASDRRQEWRPMRDGFQIKLRTKYGNFLRANGRLPPWRNSITHDIPHRSSTQDWVVWDVDVVEIRESEKSTPPPPSAKAAAQLDHVDSLDFEETGSPYSVSDRPAITFERLEVWVFFGSVWLD
ncbi:hypothetical protein LINPERPRIM_LOCUS31960 [Linum perenne]